MIIEAAILALTTKYSITIEDVEHSLVKTVASYNLNEKCLGKGWLSRAVCRLSFFGFQRYGTDPRAMDFIEDLVKYKLFAKDNLKRYPRYKPLPHVVEWSTSHPMYDEVAATFSAGHIEVKQFAFKKRGFPNKYLD